MSVTTGEELTYFNWRIDQPNNYLGVEHCIGYDVGLGWWKDDSCTANQHALCEKRSTSSFFVNICIERSFWQHESSEPAINMWDMPSRFTSLANQPSTCGTCPPALRKTIHNECGIQNYDAICCFENCRKFHLQRITKTPKRQNFAKFQFEVSSSKVWTSFF